MGKDSQNNVLSKDDPQYAIFDFVHSRIISIETCIPAVLDEIEDPKYGLVSCKPLIKFSYEEDGIPKNEDRPIIVCKFWSPCIGSDKSYIPICPKSGMTGWVIGASRDSFFSIIGNNSSKWEYNSGSRKQASQNTYSYGFGFFIPDTFINNRHLEVKGTENGLKIVRVPDDATSSIPTDDDDGINIDEYNESTHSSWNLDGENTEAAIETGDEEGGKDASLSLTHLVDGETTKVSISTKDLDKGNEAKLRECYVITDASSDSITVCKAKVLAFFDEESSRTIELKK